MNLYVENFVCPRELILIANDKETLKGQYIKLFSESFADHKCLTLKSQFKNISNEIMDVLGMAFYLDEISLETALNTVNQLGLVCHQSILQSNWITNVTTANDNLSLSMREKEWLIIC